MVELPVARYISLDQCWRIRVLKRDHTVRRMTTKTASEAAGQGHGTAGCVKQRGASVSNKLPKIGMGMGGGASTCGW